MPENIQDTWIINKYSILGVYYTGSQAPKSLSEIWRRFRDYRLDTVLCTCENIVQTTTGTMYQDHESDSSMSLIKTSLQLVFATRIKPEIYDKSINMSPRICRGYNALSNRPI